MLLDSQLQFSAAQALTATAVSSNIIDLGPLGGLTANTIRDIGAGEELHLSILVTTVLDSAGEAATLTVTLESDDNTGLTSATTHWTSSSIAEATLAAGYWIAQGIIIPPGAYQRYVGLRYTVGVESFTSGNVSAWLHYGRFDTRTYESAFNNSVN